MSPLCSGDNRKTVERKALACKIEQFGIEMSLCSHCTRHNRVCRVLPDSGESRQCSSCVFYGFKCDVEGVLVRDWATLEKEEERLKAERCIALDTIAIASACLSRLEKQQ